VVGYNVQVAVDTEHHLIITHEVTNSGSDRAQLANIAKQAKAVLQVDKLEAVADRGYFSSPEILACHEAGITVTLPKPMTSSAKSDGRFGRQDFVYIAEEDIYRCPAGEHLTYRYTNEEAGNTGKRRCRPGTLSFYLTKLARLGGYLARSSDPPPGSLVIWRGLSRLTDIELGHEIGAMRYVGN
jgi:hypothetical protein